MNRRPYKKPPSNDERCTENVSTGVGNYFSHSRCSNARKPSDDYPTLCGVHAAGKRRSNASISKSERRSAWRAKRRVLMLRMQTLVATIVTDGETWVNGASQDAVIEIAQRMQVSFLKSAELRLRIRDLDAEYADVERTMDDHKMNDITLDL